MARLTREELTQLVTEEIFKSYQQTMKQVLVFGLLEEEAFPKDALVGVNGERAFRVSVTAAINALAKLMEQGMSISKKVDKMEGGSREEKLAKLLGYTLQKSINANAPTLKKNAVGKLAHFLDEMEDVDL